MSTIVYRIAVLLNAILAAVPVGTNLGLFWLLWALISGRFLLSRGAVFPALADGGMPADAVRRSGAALTYGRWAIETLVQAWQRVVQREGRWQARSYEGFRVPALLTAGVTRFVTRVARNFTARRNVLPTYKGRGRGPVYGERVRPLPRTHKGKTIAATPPDATAQWVVAGRTVQAQVWDNLVLSTAKPGAAAFRCVVINDPRYQEPWVLATNLPVSAYALWGLYRDRWPIEQLPLAAKQMLGAHRAFVFGGESRHRLPELALLAGNVLTYVAATSVAVATAFGIGTAV